MGGKSTYFLSDLHLGARYLKNPLEAEKRVVRFLDSVKDDADSIYLVGDVLDYWFEYRYAVPRGHVRFFGKLAELADSGVRITWMIGNHDIWIFDYLPRELGIEVVDGVLERTIQGKRCLVTHGDGVGQMPRMFRLIRTLFRNRVCQKLYAGIHPRWSVPFAYGWSSNNRHGHPVAEPYKAIDEEPLMLFAREHAATHGQVDYYIFGHRHVAVSERVTDRATAVILGEWIDLCSYARMTDGELTLHKYKDWNHGED